MFTHFTYFPHPPFLVITSPHNHLYCSHMIYIHPTSYYVLPTTIPTLTQTSTMSQLYFPFCSTVIHVLKILYTPPIHSCMYTVSLFLHYILLQLLCRSKPRPQTPPTTISRPHYSAIAYKDKRYERNHDLRLLAVSNRLAGGSDAVSAPPPRIPI